MLQSFIICRLGVSYEPFAWYQVWLYIDPKFGDDPSSQIHFEKESLLRMNWC
jgi:hypothetical protein